MATLAATHTSPVRPIAAARHCARLRGHAFLPRPLLCKQPNPLRVGRSAAAFAASASQQASLGKLISKTEVPAFIPRADLMDQLIRWANIEAADGGVTNFGLPFKVNNTYRDGALWGFTAVIYRDGEAVSDLLVTFDEETVTKHEWVGRGADGFPVPEGNSEEVLGKNFEIRKTCERTVDDQVRRVIRNFCESLVAAINKYYAFGSCFVDDTT